MRVPSRLILTRRDRGDNTLGTSHVPHRGGAGVDVADADQGRFTAPSVFRSPAVGARERTTSQKRVSR
jgi:hypothetical protein